jgi:Ubiquinol-cytochrome-c reductase complex subunit (QCR10)
MGLTAFWVDVDGRGQSLVFWGGGALVALLLIGNKIPVVKNDVLKKIPIMRGYFVEQDNIPDSDKPF